MSVMRPPTAGELLHRQRHEHPDTQFCYECGENLWQVCPKCDEKAECFNRTVPAYYNYCHRCGRKLKEEA